jgi:hypothetical protein
VRGAKSTPQKRKNLTVRGQIEILRLEAQDDTRKTVPAFVGFFEAFAVNRLPYLFNEV